MRVLDLKINKPIQGLGFFSAVSSQILRPWATLACALNHFILYWLYWPILAYTGYAGHFERYTRYTGLCPASTAGPYSHIWGIALGVYWSETGQRSKVSLSDQSKPPEQRGNPKPGHLRGWKSFSELNAMRANMPVGPIVATAVVKLLTIHWKPKL